MKPKLELEPSEQKTLFQMSINHPDAAARLRAGGVLLLSGGEAIEVIADRCDVVVSTIYRDIVKSGVWHP